MPISRAHRLFLTTKVPRNSFIIPFSASQMTLHLDPDLT